MTKISKDLVKKLSKLAKINLSEEQDKKYANDLTSVMGQMEEIKNLDVSKILETARISKDENVLREDIIKGSLSQQDALKNSKNTHEGYFLVPMILKGD
jgi:aspartyl-tRNA(Asn)/glutamyl-tRNA(Gln) amidotransferase subunit C